MLNEIIVGVIVLLVGMLIGGLIQWARSETPAALQARDINDLNKGLGAWGQKHDHLSGDFEAFANTIRKRVERIETHLKLQEVHETGKYPSFIDARPSGEQETVK